MHRTTSLTRLRNQLNEAAKNRGGCHYPAYIDLNTRGFPPRLAAVKDMADSLLAECHQDPVGQNWAANFVKCRLELKVMFNLKYNYQRALCEDPGAIRGWF
jgi:hypothetical protein